jgi:8-oxo-dGTP diphosphatase
MTDAARTPTVRPHTFSTIFLVDRRGWVLLMERDDQAPHSPNQWGMVGGGVEPGETPEEAAYRELAEETGLAWTSGLALWRAADFGYSDRPWTNHYYLWTARCDLTDADIVVGEGRRIVFVDPARLDELDTTESVQHFLPDFLADFLADPGS